MRKALVRYLVTLAVALIAFVAVKPAFAAAPMCDPRGATMMAPAPQLQQTPTSIDANDANDETCVSDDSCTGEIAFHKLAGSGVPTWEVSHPDPSMSGASPQIASATATALLAVIPAGSRELQGVRFALDRPPRAR